jgi:hypothetical protein
MGMLQGLLHSLIAILQQEEYRNTVLLLTYPSIRPGKEHSNAVNFQVAARI